DQVPFSVETQEEDQVSHRSSTSRLSRSPLRGVKKLKNMQCKVTLLDGTDYTLTVEKRAKGQVLFDKVCDHLNLLEKDYFGITYRDIENQKNWLDPSKELKKQIRTGPWNFAFNVKFYPPDPSQLSEDITRYYLCLQLRDDVVSGRLPCSFATHTVLGSYTVQSELGDYEPEELGSDYISELRFAPNQTKELEEKVMELHKTYKGMTPAEAEMHFLENAKKLSMYGVDLHHAKDSEGVEIMLGVCASGLLIYRDRLRINRFAWPKVLKISYKRNNFYIKIRPGEFEQFESTIGFKLPNHRAAKRLWKVCVEHHTFFRLVSPEAPPKKFLGLGSKFRYSGRTQAQTRRASSQIIRPAPFFERSSSKRYNMSRSLDGGKDSGTDAAGKVIAKGDLITTVTPEKKAEEEKAEQEDTQVEAEGTTEPTPSTPLRQEKKVNLCLPTHSVQSELDTEPPEELVKHQTNISELKRSFLEAEACIPGMTEWEKRLSSSPARSPKADDAPMIEPLLPQDVSCRPQQTNNTCVCVCSMTSPRSLIQTYTHYQVSPQAAGYVVKYVVDSNLTDGATSSGPHGISLSTTMDDDVFIDGTLKEEEEEEEEEKTPNGSQEELSERSMVKISPGAVRQEVSQAISDKRGTLIILKEAEDKMATDGTAVDTHTEKEETVVSGKVEAEKNEFLSTSETENVLTCKEDMADVTDPKTAIVMTNLNMETKKVDMTQIKGTPSPKKATASWVSEVSKTEEGSEVISVSTKEVKDMTTSETLEIVQQEESSTKEVPVIHTETKTITYEAAEVDTNGDADPGVLLSAQTITSETTSTTMTTHITKTVKGGISETRIEKRIVITGDADIDHDQALAQAIKEAKQQHPDMSVTKVVVHKETEITPEEGED
uniref:Erythrocyte membrane protein band 4.1 like 3 n=1 Tax=Myripristis murdjan TaxID=586833 RepID=A0A668APF4_9TELE